MDYQRINDDKDWNRNVDWTRNVQVVPSLRPVALKEKSKPPKSSSQVSGSSSPRKSRRSSKSKAGKRSSRHSASEKKTNGDLNGDIGVFSTFDELNGLPTVHKPPRSSDSKASMMEQSFGNLSTSTPATLSCSISTLSPGPYSPANRAGCSSPRRTQQSKLKLPQSPRRLPPPPQASRSSKSKTSNQSEAPPLSPTKTKLSFNACFPNPIDFPMTTPSADSKKEYVPSNPNAFPSAPMLFPETPFSESSPPVTTLELSETDFSDADYSEDEEFEKSFASTVEQEQVVWQRCHPASENKRTTSPIRRRARTDNDSFESDFACSWEESQKFQSTEERLPTVPLFFEEPKDDVKMPPSRTSSQIRQRQQALSSFVVQHKAPRMETKARKQKVFSELLVQQGSETKRRIAFPEPTSPRRSPRARPPTPPRSRSGSSTSSLRSKKRAVTPKTRYRKQRTPAASLPFPDLEDSNPSSKTKNVFNKDADDLSVFESGATDVMVWKRF